MKHITYSDKSLLVGDAAADAITAYAAAVARSGTADTVTLRAYGVDGAEVEATFVLDTGTVLMAETTDSTIPEPDNSEVVRVVQEKTRLLDSPPPVGPHDADTASDRDTGYLDEF